MNAQTKIDSAGPFVGRAVVGRFVVDSRWHGDFDQNSLEHVTGYSIIRHYNIKGWSQLDDAEAHNNRDIHTPNAREDAPPPIELVTWHEGSFRQRAKCVISDFNGPRKLQRGGTLAFEDVLSASPEYWNRNGDWKLKSVAEIMSDPFIKQALEFAQWKHERRLISVKVHLDEETPHIHVIAVALVGGMHQVRGRKPPDCPRDENGVDMRDKQWKYTFYGSKVRGAKWQLARNHDDWANFVKHLGLIRGSDGTKMPADERRDRDKSYTGTASMIIAEAKKEAASIVAEANRGSAKALAYAASVARSDRQTGDEYRVQAAAAANQLIANAEEQARAIVSAAEQAASLARAGLDAAAKAKLEAARSEADSVVSAAVEMRMQAEAAITAAREGAGSIVSSAHASAAAAKAAAEVEGRSIIEDARRSAELYREEVRQATQKQALLDAAAIREAAEAEAARIRQDAEADYQRHSAWFASEGARHRREKDEANAAQKVARQAEAAAAAAADAIVARETAVKSAELQLLDARAAVTAREAECDDREKRVGTVLANVQKRHDDLGEELESARQLAKAMRDHYREFDSLPSHEKGMMPPQTIKARSVVQSAEFEELKRALELKKQHDNWKEGFTRT